MSLPFQSYQSTSYKKTNSGFYKKVEKLGCDLNLNLKNIDNDDMENFINEYYCKFFKNDAELIPDELNSIINDDCLPPVGSCSVIAANSEFKDLMETTFGMNVYVIYGYVRTNQHNFNKFTDAQLNSAINNNKFFNNHHAWFLFENGQLLDLVFINTMKHANNIEINHYDYIFSDASDIYVPQLMDIFNEPTIDSFFNYIPMHYGKLFSRETLIKNADINLILTH